MSIEEEFKEIVEKQEKEKIVPFLKKLTEKERKLLVPILIEYYELRIDDYFDILDKTAFVCFSYSQVNKFPLFISLDVVKDDILPWYQPPWLKQYLNAVRFHINYQTMLEFTKKGWLNPTQEYIAQRADSGLLGGTNHTIGTKEHIWYLFQYQTDIYIYDKWLEQFKKYILNHDIDRFRVLQESLLTSTRGFNRPLSSWFYKLFDFLEPTKPELLKLQDELLVSLSSPQSKCVTQTLKYIKQIHKDSSFNLQDFMQQIQILLSWDIKGIINSTLSLIDALMKHYPHDKEELALLTIQTFGQSDEKLQEKAIKILSKHKMLEENVILDEIEIYTDNLYSSIKAFLPMMKSNTIEENIIIEPISKIREDNKIPIYETFDEMVFFFSQVFEGNNVYDFDLFIANLLKIESMITVQNISKLDTLFDKAFKYYYNYRNWAEEDSKFYFIIASLLIEYNLILSHRFSNDATKQNQFIAELDNFIAQHNKEEEERNYYKHTPPFDFDNIKVSHNICYLFANQCQSLLSHLKGDKIYQMLSVPTHLPSYIDAKTLVDRLSSLDELTSTINPFDFQIALARLVFSKEIITSIETSLKGEIRDILLYMTSETIALDMKQIINPQWWIVAVLRKGISKEVQDFINHYSKETLSYPVFERQKWTVIREPWEYDDWVDGKKVKKVIINSKLKLERKRAIQNAQIDSIYRYINICNFDDVYHTEVNYGLLLSPHLNYIFLENLLANIANTYIDTTIKKALQELLPYLIETWNNSHESSYIFLAYSLTFEEKTTRTLSSELWIKATSEGTMNHQLLGETIGKLEHNEYAPLKRFTDLIVANMLNISSLHNRGLEVLLSSMIKEMNDEPIKGTKKLLEIYLEVLSLTKQKPSQEVLERLVVWGEVNSLVKIINKIKRI